MSTLANEKERLRQELERWQRRHAEIQARLAEIAQKEIRLQAFINNPALDLPPPEALERDRPRRVKARALSY